MAETVEVPFQLWGNQQVLTQCQIEETPWLRDFIRAFPHCFAHDPYRLIYIFYPDGNDNG